MSILHYKTVTIADGTNSDIVRPSDWGSVHNQVLNLGGNTAGTSQISGADIVWAGGSNITLSANGSSVSVVGPDLTPYLTTAQPPGAYLTTAAQSAHSHNLATTTTGGALIVVGTTNSNGATIGVPAFLTTAQAPGAYLTTAAQSGHSHGFATTTTGGASMVVGTSNSNGVTVGVPAYITTYANDLTSGRAGTGTTFAGTNASASMTLNTDGLNLAISAGGGVINQTGPNIAVAGSTVTSGDVYFSNSPTVTFGMAGSTITASAAGGGGGGAVTVGGAELFPLGDNTAFSTMGQNSLYVQKFICQSNVSFNNLERRVTMSTVSSTNSQQAAHTYDYGLYSRGTGASSTKYDLIASSRIWFQASFSSNVSAGYTISQGAGSFTTTSAGTGIMSQLSGFKHMYLPFTSTLTAGGQYAVAFRMSSATSVNTAPLRIGIKDMTYYSNLSVGQIYTSGAIVSNTTKVGDFAQGVYATTTSNMPASFASSGLTNAISQARMYIQFEV